MLRQLFMCMVAGAAVFMISCKDVNTVDVPKDPGTVLPPDTVPTPEPPIIIPSAIFFNNFSENKIPDGFQTYDQDQQITIVGSKGSWDPLKAGGLRSIGQFKPGATATVDNWIVTPGIAIKLKNTRLTLQLNSVVDPIGDPGRLESYQVYISTAGSSLEQLKATTPVYTKSDLAVAANDTPELNLDEYVGKTIYVAVRHNTASGAYVLKLNYISVTEYYGKDLAISGINTAKHVYKVGDKVTVNANVYNSGLEDVDGFDIQYTYGTQTVTQHSTAKIARGKSLTHTFQQQLAVESPGESLMVSVTLTSKDDNSDNNIGTVQLTCPSGEVERRILGLKLSSVNCGPCGGILYILDQREEQFPDKYVGISAHVDGVSGADDMACPGYREWLNDHYNTTSITQIGGLPQLYTNNRYGGYVDINATWRDLAAPATIALDINFDPASRKLLATVNSVFVANALTEGYFRLGLVLTEDGISAWQQNGGENPIHNHTARVVLGGPRGEEGSLPKQVVKDQKNSHVFEYTIPEGYGHTKPYPVRNTPVLEKMHVIAILYDYRTAEVLNCTKVKLIK